MSPQPDPHQPQSKTRALSGLVVTHGMRKAVTVAGTATVSTLGWPVILAVAAALLVLVIVLVVAVVVAFSQMQNDRDMFTYQCESRLGSAVGETAALAVVPRLQTSVSLTSAPPATSWETTALQPTTTTPPESPPPEFTAPANSPPASATPSPTTTSPTPTTTPPANPYATLTVPPSADDRVKACAEALKTGELVAAPISSPGTEVGRQAATVANSQVGLMAAEEEGDTAGPTNEAFSAANLVRHAYYQASEGEIALPTEVADQITVGDRVDPNAISPGDLVFFNFSADAGPTAVMIAITPTLGIDATTIGEPIAIGVLPSGNTIIKRPYSTTAVGS